MGVQFRGGYYDNQGNWHRPGRRWQDLIPVCITIALAMVVADGLLSGLHFDSFGSVIFAALLFSLINWSIKPIIHVLTLPITFLTFGLFALVVNGLMLELVDFFIQGFVIESFGSAILGSIIITICNMLVNAIIPRN